VLIHSSRRRELLIGLLFVLAPVFMFIPVMEIQVYAPSKWWTDRIEGAAYLLVIVCELWGVGRLLNCLTKKVDLIALCAFVICLAAIFFLV
jgi:hypothetical protein